MFSRSLQRIFLDMIPTTHHPRPRLLLLTNLIIQFCSYLIASWLLFVTLASLLVWFVFACALPCLFKALCYFSGPKSLRGNTNRPQSQGDDRRGKSISAELLRRSNGCLLLSTTKSNRIILYRPPSLASIRRYRTSSSAGRRILRSS